MLLWNYLTFSMFIVFWSVSQNSTILATLMSVVSSMLHKTGLSLMLPAPFWWSLDFFLIHAQQTSDTQWIDIISKELLLFLMRLRFSELFPSILHNTIWNCPFEIITWSLIWLLFSAVALKCLSSSATEACYLKKSSFLTYLFFSKKWCTAWLTNKKNNQYQISHLSQGIFKGLI